MKHGHTCIKSFCSVKKEVILSIACHFFFISQYILFRVIWSGREICQSSFNVSEYEGQSKISESYFISDKRLLVWVFLILSKYINLKP